MRTATQQWLAMTNPYMQSPYTQQSPQSGVSPVPYGQQYGAPPPEHPQGTPILIFGIIGIFFSIFAAIAWYMGANAMKEIQASGIRYSNEANINAGRILGKVITILALVGLAIVIVLWILFGLVFAARLSGL
jgi:hypothetical protein